ncbi:MAG: sigma-54-dependent Fis family transcriptional regulator, partial [Candidatus Aureabacteria bacterium]|nr:sigma-54-dependent Fis family transcriptional regulator [Candidatus Auribacterota bacterium]
ERIVALSDGGHILLEHLPEKILIPGQLTEVAKTKNLKEFVHDKEKVHIQRILKETGGDKKKAARLMGIDLATLYRKIDRWKVSQ